MRHNPRFWTCSIGVADPVLAGHGHVGRARALCVYLARLGLPCGAIQRLTPGSTVWADIVDAPPDWQLDGCRFVWIGGPPVWPWSIPMTPRTIPVHPDFVGVWEGNREGPLLLGWGGTPPPDPFPGWDGILLRGMTRAEIVALARRARGAIVRGGHLAFELVATGMPVVVVIPEWLRHREGIEEARRLGLWATEEALAADDWDATKRVRIFEQSGWACAVRVLQLLGFRIQRVHWPTPLREPTGNGLPGRRI